MPTFEEIFRQRYGRVFDRWESHIKVTCPNCGSKSLACNIVNGLIFCHSCTFGKGLPPPKAATPSTVPPQEIEPELHKAALQCLIDNSSLEISHRAYLRGRGVYHPEKFKLVTVPWQPYTILSKHFSDDQLHRSGLYRKYPDGLVACRALQERRILIPILNNGEIVGGKTRENPFGIFTEDPTYLIVKGPKREIPFWWTEEPASVKDVIITEGELKAMAACSINLYCLASNGHAIPKGGLEKLKEILNRIKFERLFVVYDSEADPKKQKSVDSSSGDILRFFSPKCARVRLPLLGRQKMDLDTYLLSQGEKYFLDLLEDSWASREIIVKLPKTTPVYSRRRFH